MADLSFGDTSTERDSGFDPDVEEVLGVNRPLKEPVRSEGIIGLPSRGTLKVISDLHGQYELFNNWLEYTNVVREIKNGEDTYALMLGDATDLKGEETRKANADYILKDGDRRIVDRVMEIKEELGNRADHFVYLTGNHELTNLKLYRMAREEAKSDLEELQSYSEEITSGDDKDVEKVKEELKKTNIDEIIDRKRGAQQYDFVTMMDDRHYDFLSNRPMAAIAENGLVLVHGGPPKEDRFYNRTENMSRDIDSKRGMHSSRYKGENLVFQIHWNRPDCLKVDKERFSDRFYGEDSVERFLDEMGGEVLITGHSRVEIMGEEYVKEGLGFFGNQVVLDTDQRKYLELDLEKEYCSARELEYGKEIKELL